MELKEGAPPTDRLILITKEGGATPDVPGQISNKMGSEGIYVIVGSQN